MDNYFFLHMFQTIVTGAGDETLRFWNVFPCSKSQVIIGINQLPMNSQMIFLCCLLSKFSNDYIPKINLSSKTHKQKVI